MQPLFTELISQNIKKTGFVLEYQVSQILEKHGWTVINNRYYLDDVTNLAREIDLLAYKVNFDSNVYYYTTLLISCKKSERNAWTFLSKKKRGNRNYDYCPITNWTNEPYLKYMLENSEWKSDFHKEIGIKECLSKTHSLSNHVFAFQEIVNSEYKNKNRGEINNDTNIYDSITSLVKALSYELIFLNSRKKEHCFYNFQLLTVADLDLYESYFENDTIITQSINDIKYINRFIVRNKDSFQRIDFVNMKILDEKLKDYDSLHEWNSCFYSKIKESFYDNLIQDEKRIKFQLELCKKELMNKIYWELPNRYEIKEEYFNDIDLWNPFGENEIKIITSFDDKTVQYLNSTKSVLEKTAEWLKKYFRFEGKFEYQEELPF